MLKKPLAPAAAFMYKDLSGNVCAYIRSLSQHLHLNQSSSYMQIIYSSYKSLWS